MPIIPEFRGSGQISPDIGAASVVNFPGRTIAAVEQIGSQLQNFGLTLLRERTRAQAEAFNLEQKEGFARDLTTISIETQQQHPDGTGYDEAFRQKADTLRAKYDTHKAPSPFAHQVTSSVLDQMFQTSITEAAETGHRLRNNAAVQKTHSAIQNAALAMQLRPNQKTALDSIRNIEQVLENKMLYSVEHKQALRKEISIIPVELVEGFMRQNRYAEARAVLRDDSPFAPYFDVKSRGNLLDRLMVNERQYNEFNKERLNGLVKNATEQLLSNIPIDRKELGALYSMLLADPGRADDYMQVRVAEEINDKVKKYQADIIAMSMGGVAENITEPIALDVDAGMIAETVLKEAREHYKNQPLQLDATDVRLTIQSKLQSIQKFREREPTKSMVQQVPLVRDAWAKALSSQKDMHEAIVTNLIHQKLHGIRQVQAVHPDILSKFASELSSSQNTPAQLKAVVQMQELFGEFYPVALKQMIAHDPSLRNYAVLEHYRNTETIAQVLNNIRVMPDIQKELRDSENKLFREAVRIRMGKLDGLLKRSTTYNSGVHLFNALTAHVEVLAFQQMRSGVSQRDAIDNAYKKMIDDEFMFIEEGGLFNSGYSLMLPRIDASGKPIDLDTVKEFTADSDTTDFLNKKGVSVAQYPEFLANQSMRKMKSIDKMDLEIENTELRKQLLKTTFWVYDVDRSGHSGLRLMRVDSNWNHVPVFGRGDKGPEPIFVSFSEIQKEVIGKRKAAFEKRGVLSQASRIDHGQAEKLPEKK